MQSLEELAVKQLSLPLGTPASSIPDFYLAELKTHLAVQPNDTNFRIELQPGTGFGVINCLENGCAAEQIVLARAFNLAGGGKAQGLGSLSAYRRHCTGHPTHALQRDLRIGRNGSGNPSTASSTRATLSRKTLLSRLDSGFGGPSPLPGPSSHVVRSPASHPSTTSRSLEVYRDVTTSQPLKRPASGSDDEGDVVIVSSQMKKNSSPPAKKIKSDPVVAKAPFPLSKEQVTALASPGPTPLGVKILNTAPVPSIPLINDVTTARAEVIKIDGLIHTAQTTINSMLRGNRKKQVTKARQKEIARQQGYIDFYNRSRTGYQTIIKQYDDYIRHQTAQATLQVLAAPLAASSVAIRGGLADLDVQFSDSEDEQGVPGVRPHVPAISHFLHSNATNEQVEFSTFFETHTDCEPFYDSIKQFIADIGCSEQFDANATVVTALAKLGLSSLSRPLPGMSDNCCLLPHQAIGVAWMLEKEKFHKGGILADEMGLGKTVQMISTLCLNRSTDPKIKTTLIVAPLALLEQWQTEIETKTNDIFNCLIYHGPNKPKSKAELKKFDVILTTFQTLALECPPDEEKEKARKARKKRRAGSDTDDFITDDEKRTRKMKKGPLMGISWYRIVLDEAQNIRNRNTRISEAVTQLDGVYRWCLTGTPITNGLADGFGLLRFLRVRPWNDWTDYNNHIARLEKKQPELGSERLQMVFKQCLLRRKKDTKLDGKPLIELPPKEVILHRLHFSSEEKEIYDFVEARSQAKFNRFLQAGTVLKNYSIVLVMLLRLRQICVHPSLLAEYANAFETEENAIDGKSKQAVLSKAASVVSQDFVNRIKAKLKQQMLARIAAEKESVHAQMEVDDDECPICYEPLADAVVTQCGHFFCFGCVDTVLSSIHVEDVNDANHLKPDERPCPSCRDPIHRARIFDRKAFEPTDAELNGKPEPESMDMDSEGDFMDLKDVRPKKSCVRKRALVSAFEDDDEDLEDLDDFIVQSEEDEEEKDLRKAVRLKAKGEKKPRRKLVVRDSDEEEDDSDEEGYAEVSSSALHKGKGDTFGTAPKIMPKLMPKFIPSAKMKMLMELLEMTKASHPHDKTIIISQWTGCLDLLADYLNEKGFRYVRYQGGMLRQERDKAVKTFMTDEQVPCMLMSLKAGGVGLNLVRANRVISLDLAWSEAVESQAFDRVHRLGQQKNVHIERLVIGDSVEEKVLAMQDRKKAIAEGSLGEGNGKKIGRLSVAELANLFGLDSRGNRL